MHKNMRIIKFRVGVSFRDDSDPFSCYTLNKEYDLNGNEAVDELHGLLDRFIAKLEQKEKE